jgi:hypothetical protein
MPTAVNLSSVLTANSAKPYYDYRYPSGNRPPFVALLKDDFSSGTLGVAKTGWDSKSVYANDHPTAGGKSLKLTVAPNTQSNLDASACAGGHFYGGRSVLPVTIPIGKTIWVSMKRFIPTNFTWGYCYAGSDSAAATACGKESDGNAWLKDLVLAPLTGTERIYVLPAASRRSITQTAGNRIASEHNTLYHDEPAVIYPLGQWFTHQVSVFVHDTGIGRIRHWLNSTLVNEVVGANISSGNSLNEWGIGDYWNGLPYTNGSAALSQWVREVIIATDVSGYGAPTGIDSSGNVFIDPSTTVASLS